MAAKGPLVIQKYGGTSVGSPERIQSVAKRIQHTRNQGYQLVIVVSAMGSTTDDLIALAHQVSPTPLPREMDMLLTAGERISMALLSMALADLKVPAVSFTGSQSGIITEGTHQNGKIKKILGDRVRAELAAGKVVIVAGFQGVSENKEITTLGRGGSDTTAVALAATLGAESCEIYTDVNGVMNADPRKVSQASVFKELPYDLMIELAHRGAGVLHPRCVELAKSRGVTIRVLSSLVPLVQGPLVDTGTTIKKGVSVMEQSQVIGVTCDSDKVSLEIELMRASAVSAIWDFAQEQELSLLAPTWEGTGVRVFIERDAVPIWKKHLENLVIQGFLRTYKFCEDQVPVSLVGERISQEGLILSKVLQILSAKNIAVHRGVTSPQALTLTIDRPKADEAVRLLFALASR